MPAIKEEDRELFDELVIASYNQLVEEGCKHGPQAIATYIGNGTTRKNVKSALRRVSDRLEPQRESELSDFFPETINGPDVGFFNKEDANDTIADLRSEVKRLRKILEFASHHEDSEFLGGTFTINCSDLHYTNKGHLIDTCKNLEDKSIELITRFSPRKIQVSINGDIVQGRGIYRNQHMDNVISKGTDQIKAAAFRAYEFHTKLMETFPDSTLHYYVTQGNHDYSNGDSTSVPFVWACRQLGMNMTYCGYRHILNIADDGIYNVLIKHGYGNSSFHPTPPRLIHETLKEVLHFQNRGYTKEKKIYRIWHGHTHWMSVGTEHAEGLIFDVTGGVHRNDRANLGLNNRPCGWIGYISPLHSSDILSPIEITPSSAIYNREIDDPELTEKNRIEAARCIIGFNDLAERLNIIKHGLGE